MDKVIDFNINSNIDNSKISQIEQLCESNTKLSIEDIETLLSNLSYLVRKKIADYENKDINNYLYTNKCDLAQSIICYYLNKIGVNVNPINTNEIMPGICGHSLTVASFDTLEGEKKYLIDPTYLQFFSKEKCDKNKFVIINDKVCLTPDPGYFVIESNSEKIIEPLLENGYIEFTEEVAKVYGDSFFKTKQGVPFDQINNNLITGSNYIKWFFYYISNLSKTEEELSNMDLLINPINYEKGNSK